MLKEAAFLVVSGFNPLLAVGGNAHLTNSIVVTISIQSFATRSAANYILP